ncbi:MAG: nuclear transport factor 2 family protein [Desulfobacteraceae bacterium]|nr:nuclear transport factor 2 family protein [Desulfobacteraceae bacterium]MBC2749642.1 nuclear transport factor 2 family protein [Desulfobacteraceae bacterium]
MANIEGLMRDCVKAMAEGKNTEATDFFADDGVWITPFGKFVGKERIKHFLDWQNSQMSYTVEIAGNDIIASDKKAFYEHFIKANVQGKPVALSAMCAWEFNKDDKVKECRTVYDRFSTLEQAASGIGKFMVGLIAKQFTVR